MAKVANKTLLIVALLLSLCIAILIFFYLKGVESNKTVHEGMPVIVAKVDIAPKTRITADMVSEVKVPPEYIQPGAVQGLDKVVGIVARETIASGEQVSERRLVRESKTVGFSGIIPRDKRAVTIAVNEVTGVAGFIKAGDYTDVVVTFDVATVGGHVSQVIMQNILVLAANRESEISVANSAVKDGAKELTKTATVTLAVTPDEAVKLSFAEEKGKLRLALRPYLPSDNIASAKAITAKDLVGDYVVAIKNQQPAVQSSNQAPPAVERPEAKGKSSGDRYGIQVIRGTKIE